MMTTEGHQKHDYVKEMYYAAGRGAFTAYKVEHITDYVYKKVFFSSRKNIVYNVYQGS